MALYPVLLIVISLTNILSVFTSSSSVLTKLTEPQIESLLKQASEHGHFMCPTESGRYSAGEDCTKFYVCDNSRARLRQCLTGLMFDSVRKRCVPQSQAVCGRQELDCPARFQLRQEGFQCPTGGIAGYPDTRNCSQYHLCIFGRRFGLNCSQNRAFDSPSRRCISRAEAKCERPDNYVCDSNGLYSHPFGCDRYYKCCNGQATVEYCGSGRLFNGQQCVWSLGILERCPNPQTTPMPSTLRPSTTNQTSNTGNGTLTFEPSAEALYDEDNGDASISVGPTFQNSSFEAQKLEVEKLIYELSSST